MKWIKKGLIIGPIRNLDWMVTHAALPFAERIDADRYRIYFSGRNSQNMYQVGYVEIDIKDPQEILYITENPVLALGPLGSFDDSGVTASWIVNYESKKYMYYVGWMQGKRVLYYASIGLAISQDGGNTFKKISKAPIIERNNVDPYMTLSLCVMIENELWRMWYTSGLRWEIENNNLKSYYHIKYAESIDGINWERNGIVCIDFKSKEENAIGRPCFLKEDDIYKMWYSYSGYCGRGYRIGYAESNDGIHWERKDEEAGIDVSESGWDSEMVCYPFVFEHKGKKYMLYNGNSFGKAGFGYAILDENK
jgi:predicted GH43/DUF377 family glycosyl hydrolase